MLVYLSYIIEYMLRIFIKCFVPFCQFYFLTKYGSKTIIKYEINYNVHMCDR